MEIANINNKNNNNTNMNIIQSGVVAPLANISNLERM